MSVCTAANTTPNSAVASPSARTSTPHHQICAQQVEGDAQHAVDRGLQHDRRSSAPTPARARPGCASGSHTCSGSMPGLGAETEQASKNATVAQNGDSWPRACRRKCSRRGRPAARRSTTGCRSRRRGRSADRETGLRRISGALVIGGDQKIGGERHRFPGHHEDIGVVGQQPIASGETRVKAFAGRAACASPLQVTCGGHRGCPRSPRRASAGKMPRAHPGAGRGGDRAAQRQHQGLARRQRSARRRQYQRPACALGREQHRLTRVRTCAERTRQPGRARAIAGITPGSGQGQVRGRYLTFACPAERLCRGRAGRCRAGTGDSIAVANQAAAARSEPIAGQSLPIACIAFRGAMGKTQGARPRPCAA